ncbi:hypothetical protein QQF64_006010 [Cirrhinus molitorella]|uniref:Uncharacterized protein n=1 Tax=Cirrhinus molitorella TaxID=172907 RepID=A0ABR3MDZ8_9TELE
MPRAARRILVHSITFHTYSDPRVALGSRAPACGPQMGNASRYEASEMAKQPKMDGAWKQQGQDTALQNGGREKRGEREREREKERERDAGCAARRALPTCTFYHSFSPWLPLLALSLSFCPHSEERPCEAVLFSLQACQLQSATPGCEGPAVVWGLTGPQAPEKHHPCGTASTPLLSRRLHTHTLTDKCARTHTNSFLSVKKQSIFHCDQRGHLPG